MEPDDLTSSAEDARLASLLRQTALPALPDNGFSAAVLSALPPPRRRSAPARHRDLIVAVAAVVVVLAIQLGQSGGAGTLSALVDSLHDVGSILTGRNIAIAIAVLAGALTFLEDPEAPDLL